LIFFFFLCSDQSNRYKDDVYDWIWPINIPWSLLFVNQTVTHPLELEESKDVHPNTNNDPCKLPSEVMRNAVQSLNVSYPLIFSYPLRYSLFYPPDPAETDEYYYVYLDRKE
jgi:hypothetical protein